MIDFHFVFKSKPEGFKEFLKDENFKKEKQGCWSYNEEESTRGVSLTYVTKEFNDNLTKNYGQGTITTYAGRSVKDGQKQIEILDKILEKFDVIETNPMDCQPAK